VRPLTRDEAQARAERITVHGYAIDFDLTTGAETFGVRTTVRFGCRVPGEPTFIEHNVPRLRSARLNGTELDLDRVRDDNRISLVTLAAENELVVEADGAYSTSGEGLHRSVDPEDGEVYLHSEAFLDFGQRMFACFDQPDLKATFELSVTAPIGWTVLANAPGEETAPGRWAFEATPPISTYLVELAAGPYHSVYQDRDGLRLGIHCRRSLARYLDADEIFEVTRQGLDYYEPLFGRPYPFAKYDQIFVPDMGGAMENPGLVTYMDSYIFRSPVTDDQRRERAYTLAHELAHMWFGDLVTMRWWDDLWLNESFATYMGYRAVAEATRHRLAWTDFALGDKAWGYRADGLPTSHPVSADAPDSEAALLNFDGISYQKGAGIIKQLVAWIGDAPFRDGLRSYIERHAWGNTTLADLLGYLERASGRQLGPWADAWLRTAGIAGLRPTVEIGPDGRYTAAAVEQVAPAEHPTLRSHRIAIGLFDAVGERLVRRGRLEVDVSGARTEVPELVGAAAPDVLLLNDEDLTWAKVRLDDRTLSSIRAGAIPRIDDALARALLWMSILDMNRDAELASGEALSIIIDGLEGEPEMGNLAAILMGARAAIDAYGRPEWREARLRRLSRRLAGLLGSAAPGSDGQQAFARALATVAIEPVDLDRLLGWLAGHGVPDGLPVGPDLRWSIVARLATLGRIDRAAIEAEAARDQTTAGSQGAAAAMASLPDLAIKQDIWQRLVRPDGTPGGIRFAIARAFWRPEQVDLCRPFLEQFLRDVRALLAGPSSAVGLSLGIYGFPKSLVTPGSIARLEAELAQPDLDPTFRRIVVEGHADVTRAARARAIDREP